MKNTVTLTDNYVAMEMHLTHILERLEDLRKNLVEFADNHVVRHQSPLCDIEESIIKVLQAKEELKNLDLSYLLRAI